jgi:hypothetical protein
MEEFPPGQKAMDVEVQGENSVDLLFRHHFESAPEGTAVTQTQARRVVRDRSLILHRDNAPARPSLRVSQFSAGQGISAMDRPPYSPDFCLFLELKSVLKGKRFSDLRTLYHL